MKSGRGVVLISVLLAGVGTYLWRVVFFLLFRKRSMKRSNLVIIGSGNAMETLYQIMKDSPEYRVLGVIPDDSSHLWRSPEIPRISGDPKNLRHISRTLRVNVLVLAMSHFRDPELLKAALDCKLDGVAVFDMPSFYENVTGKVPVEHVTDFWLVFAPLLGVKKNVYNTKLKRSFDIALAFLGLVLALPPALLIAAVVALDSRGPILYQQRRVGLNDNVFTLLKFRSMKLDMDNDREHAGKKNDPRITRAGKVLRLFRLDELPQLWNVLKGDMSFIGPRALIEEEVQEFESKIPYFSLRHSIRPGISGWAQINYRHGAKVEDGLEKLQYDLFYIKNLSPLLDFIILMRTIKVVLSGRGAR
jgi:exopolysaccharide biosynthesis polyprenyl glycosylphosphotransferase